MNVILRIALGFLAAIFAIAIIMALGMFISWQVNPQNWDQLGRVIAAYLGVVIGFFAFREVFSITKKK